MVDLRAALVSRLVLAAMLTVFASGSTAQAQSALDGFDPGASNLVLAMAVQPDGRIVVGGYFGALGGGGTGTTTRHYIGRLNPDGSLDGGFDPDANDGVLAIALQPDGKILIGGYFTRIGPAGGVARNRIARLNADGTLDMTFDPGADEVVYAIALQPDGKVLVGGSFNNLGGGTGTTIRRGFGRLNANGSLDTSFDPPIYTSQVFAVQVQPDGKIVVGAGFFYSASDGERQYLVRFNADGSRDAAFAPGADGAIRVLALQPDRKILVAGDFNMLGGGGSGTTLRNKIGRLHANGTLDQGFNPGANSLVFAMAVQADGKILVGGFFGGLGGGTGATPRALFGRINPDGSVDASFNPGASSDISNADVRALAVQPDGKILVGGGFQRLGGGTGTTPRSRIGRVYADGSLDAPFNPGANGLVYALAVQPDEKIVVGGNFTAIGGGGTGGTPRNGLARLRVDGSVDPVFNPGVNPTGFIYAVAVQPDGKILVGGSFSGLGGGNGATPRQYIGRLNADGSVDLSFNPGANGDVRAFAVQADGKILVGGGFVGLGGGTGSTLRRRIGRLNADGTVDMTFDPGADDLVWSLAVQPDGDILVGGYFTGLGGSVGATPRLHIGRITSDGFVDDFNPGADNTVDALAATQNARIVAGGAFTHLDGESGTTPRNHLGRFDLDGALDSTFDPGPNGTVGALALQPNRAVVIAGMFSSLRFDGTMTKPAVRRRLARLNADGSLDLLFDPGANDTVLGLAVQADGKLLPVGVFTTLGGGGTGTATRFYIGRLASADAAIQHLAVSGDGTTITWSRSGAGPDFWRVSFEASVDGAPYVTLGSGGRVTGGWQLSGQALATSRRLLIRARGYFGTGYHGGSGSIVESVRAAYIAMPFSDDPLAAGVSAIRAVHVVELRSRVNSLRVRFGLAPFNWTGGAVGSGAVVQSVHVAELRTALLQAYQQALHPAPAFTDPTLVQQSTPIRAAHIRELREAVLILEAS